MSSNQRDLQFYLRCFNDLRCAKSNGIEAPHKPVLLLIIAHLFAQQKLSGSSIAITDELKQCFKQIWAQYICTNHHPNLGMPFYHLRGETFGWQLSLSPQYDPLGNHNQQLKSLKNLKQAKAVAHIHEELALLLEGAESNQKIQHFLIQRYFPRSHQQRSATLNAYLQKISYQSMMRIIPIFIPSVPIRHASMA